MIEPLEPEAPAEAPANGYDGIPEEVVCGPTPAAKRVIDVVGGSMLIGVLWPLWALGAALIKLDSPGPVLRQAEARRTGRGRVRLLQVPHDAPREEDRTT